MHVTEVGYRRIKNLGNYESEEAKVTLALAEGDCESEAMTKAKTYVLTHLGLQEEKKTTKKKVAKKKVAKKTAPKEERVVTHEDVKKTLQSLWKKEGKDVAINLLKEYEVKKSDELPEEKLLEVITKAEEMLK